MNPFRLLLVPLSAAWLMMAALAILLAGALAGAADGPPEVVRALVALAVVLGVLLLLLCLLLCLARAWDRLKDRPRREDLRGGDPAGSADLRGRLPRDERFSLDRLCEALLTRKRYGRCGEVPVPVTRLPDPCIYSQFFLMDQGLSVTWDNPDVSVFLAGVEQDTYHLQPATTYDVVVSLKNASPYFDALGTQVTVNLLTFGIGQVTSSPLSSTVIDIPASTPPGPPVPFGFQWTSPATPGHYCLQVLLAHADDVNPANNEGWNNTNVEAVQAGQKYVLEFPVGNAVAARTQEAKRAARLAAKADDRGPDLQEVALVVDSYELPRIPAAEADPDLLFIPAEAAWPARVTPSPTRIGGGQTTEARLEIEVPAAAAAGTRQRFNVNATAGGRPLGGITVTLEVQ